MDEEAGPVVTEVNVRRRETQQPRMLGLCSRTQTHTDTQHTHRQTVRGREGVKERSHGSVNLRWLVCSTEIFLSV